MNRKFKIKKCPPTQVVSFYGNYPLCGRFVWGSRNLHSLSRLGCA